MKTKAKTTVLGFRVDEVDLRRLDALVKVIPYASRGNVTRDALRRGMAQIEIEYRKTRRK